MAGWIIAGAALLLAALYLVRKVLTRRQHREATLMARMRSSAMYGRLYPVLVKCGQCCVERIIIRFAMITHVGSWWNTRKQLDKLDRLLKKYPPEKSRYLVNFTGQTSFKFNEMFRKEIYGQGKAYAFEDMVLIGPEQYDPYLKSLYGDYMTPPKESDRNAHAAELVPVEEVE